MADYERDTFTIGLEEFAQTQGLTSKDFNLGTIVVKDSYAKAVDRFNDEAQQYDAVVAVREGYAGEPGGKLLGTQLFSTWYVIRGTGVNKK